MDILLKNYKILNDDETKELLSIRNLEQVRLVSSNTKFINLKEHKEWVKNLDEDVYFAVFVKGELCGGVNLVKTSQNTANFGVFFKPLTDAFCISACLYWFLDYSFLKFKTINALVKTQNKNALKFDKNFGFKELLKDENLTILSQTDIEWMEHKSSKFMRPIKNLLKSFNITIKE